MSESPFLRLNDIPLYSSTFCLSILWSLCVFISGFILFIEMVTVSVSCVCCKSGGLKQQKFLLSHFQRPEVQNPGVSRPCSRQRLQERALPCSSQLLVAVDAKPWPLPLSSHGLPFCLCQSSLCLSVRTLVMYHLGSTFSLLQLTWWLAQISSQWGLELQCGFNWTKHQRCPKDVSLGKVSPEMPPDTWGSLEKGKRHWVMIKTLRTQLMAPMPK